MALPFWIYLLRCADGSYYAGHTDDLARRLAQHHDGSVRHCYTSRRRPVVLVYSEAFATREEALAAERQVKGWSRRKKEALIQGDWAQIRRLARGKRVSACQAPLARAASDFPGAG